MSKEVKFETVIDILTYLFLGKAFFTIKSLKTGNHFTYRVSASPRRGDLHFVWVKSITNTFVYLGSIKNKRNFELTDGSNFDSKSLPYIAFKYLLDVAFHKTEIPPQLEVYHTGRCGRCGRWISTPDSIKRGIGPECYKVLGFQGTM